MSATIGTITPTGASLPLRPKPPGDLMEVLVTLTGDASYATGGYAFGVAQMPFPMTYIETVEVVGVSPNANTVADAYFNYATGKLQLLGSTGAEIANATNVSATTIQLKVKGR